MKPFIPKQDQTLPDSYQITIQFVTGRKEVFEAASHELTPDKILLEIWTKDDLCYWLPMANIEHLSFDKNFSKIIAKKLSESK